MLKIVFVCTGNICRSPIAEGLLRYKWNALNRNDLVVSSMGIHGLDNKPASEFAVQVCKEHGFDISSHRSRPVSYDELSDSDMIFCLERMQKDYINLFFPGLSNKVFLLGAWPGKETRKSNIKDPIGGNIKKYRKAYDIIESHIDRVIQNILD